MRARLRISGQVARSFAGLGVRGVEVAGKLLLYVVVAYRLGAGQAGLYFVALSWNQLGSAIARMGLERAIMRHLPAELAMGHRAAARRVLLWTAGWIGLGAAAIAALTALLAAPVADFVFGKPEFALPLALSALLIVPDALAIVAGNALIGLKRPVAAQMVQNALWPLLALIGVLAGLDRLDAVLLATAAGRAFTAALGAAMLRRAWPELAGPNAASTEAAATQGVLWRTAMPLYAVELVQATLITLPTLVLGIFASAAEVGAFSAANRLSMLTWVVLVSISSVAAPHFAAHERRGEWAQLRAVNRTARLTSAVIALPPLVAMMLAPYWLLEQIGPGFGIAAWPLRIMVVGQMVNAALSGQDILLAMAGHGAALRRLNLLQLATCLVLSATAIPFLGIDGAALLVAATMAQGGIGTMLVARRLMPRAF